MSLVEKLREQRHQQTEAQLEEFIKCFIDHLEEHLCRYVKAFNVTVRLLIESDGKEACLLLNNEPTQAFDISGLIGTANEKYIQILAKLEPEGFEGYPEIKRVNDSDEVVYMIGFDI